MVCGFVLENNGSTPVVGQRIIVDGNFTEYIDQNFSGSAKILDLANTPWGFYELGFTAVDDHENLSSRLAQTIEIRDAQAPFLTLLETYVSEGIKPRVLTTESNESIDRVIAQQDLSSYDITYALTNDANWTWPLGVPFIIDGDDATLLVNIRDNKDGEIEDLNFTHAYGSEGNFTNNTGTFDLEFFAQDNAGNEMNVTLALEVVAELETEVTGIDGYLQGAEVIFDADGDGISDLNRVFRTDENGKEIISFSRAEFKAIDTNGNGKLDASEGRFIIRGGIDTSTGTQFHGVLQADANSSVVSPLTSLVQAIMDQNVSKSDALTMVREAFGLSEEIDLTTYDPFAQFAEDNATSVLVANLRVANIINQAEGLLRAINADYNDSEISTKILSEIGSIITKSTANFDLQESFANVIPQALQESKAGVELDPMDHLLFVQYISQADTELSSESFNLQLLSSEAKEDFQTSDFDIFVQMDLWESEFAEINPVEALQDFTFSLNYDPSMGKVLITDQLSGEIFPYDSELTFKFGQIIDLNATALEGHEFKQWQDGQEQAGISLVIKQDMQLVAEFEPKEYNLEVSAAEGGPPRILECTNLARKFRSLPPHLSTMSLINGLA